MFILVDDLKMGKENKATNPQLRNMDKDPGKILMDIHGAIQSHNVKEAFRLLDCAHTLKIDLNQYIFMKMVRSTLF